MLKLKNGLKNIKLKNYLKNIKLINKKNKKIL